ncbi:hypothetical protein M1D47_09020 [Bacillus sp. R1-10]
MTEEKYNGYDTSIVYDYKDQPDIKSGRCDNCDKAQFKSSVKSPVDYRVHALKAA